MVEEIEEELENEYEFLKFDVKYIKIKTYRIIIDLPIIDKGTNKIIRTTFDYIWSKHTTDEANMRSIKHYVKDSIIKMFRR